MEGYLESLEDEREAWWPWLPCLSTKEELILPWLCSLDPENREWMNRESEARMRSARAGCDFRRPWCLSDVVLSDVLVLVGRNGT